MKIIKTANYKKLALLGLLDTASLKFISQKIPGQVSIGDKVNAYGHEGEVVDINNDIFTVNCPKEGITKDYSISNMQHLFNKSLTPKDQGYENPHQQNL